jgi:hypothetical protein
MDQLDEISRRDALKYAGATAAGAAVGQPKDAKALDNSKDTLQKVAGICYVYIACKEGPYKRFLQQGTKVTVPPEICQQTNSLIQKFIGTHPGGREFLNSIYSNVYTLVKEDEERVPFTGSVLNHIFVRPKFAQQLVDNFASLMEFRESISEEVSTDAVRRINDLFKDK